MKPYIGGACDVSTCQLGRVCVWSRGRRTLRVGKEAHLRWPVRRAVLPQWRRLVGLGIGRVHVRLWLLLLLLLVHLHHLRVLLGAEQAVVRAGLERLPQQQSTQSTGRQAGRPW
jgi:hypothetical protein